MGGGPAAGENPVSRCQVGKDAIVAHDNEIAPCRLHRDRPGRTAAVQADYREGGRDPRRQRGGSLLHQEGRTVAAGQGCRGVDPPARNGDLLQGGDRIPPREYQVAHRTPVPALILGLDQRGEPGQMRCGHGGAGEVTVAVRGAEDVRGGEGAENAVPRSREVHRVLAVVGKVGLVVPLVGSGNADQVGEVVACRVEAVVVVVLGVVSRRGDEKDIPLRGDGVLKRLGIPGRAPAVVGGDDVDPGVFQLPNIVQAGYRAVGVAAAA